MAPSAEEVVVPFVGPKGSVKPTTQVRSTWLSSSLRALRAVGAFERYLCALPKVYHDQVLMTVAGIWLPMDIAIAHYRACNMIDLTLMQRIEVGKYATRFNNRRAFELAIRLARTAGVTPWVGYAQQKRLWQASWEGGDVGVWKIGPKEARIEIVGWACSEFGYVRDAMHGVILGQTELFCVKAYVHAIGPLCTKTSLGYRIAWA